MAEATFTDPALSGAGLAASIRAVLDQVHDPCSVASGVPMGLTEMGLVAEVEVSAEGDVAIALRLTSPFCHMIGFFQAESKRLVGALPGVRSVSLTADMGLDWLPSMIAPAAQERRRLRLEPVRRAG